MGMLLFLARWMGIYATVRGVHERRTLPYDDARTFMDIHVGDDAASDAAKAITGKRFAPAGIAPGNGPQPPFVVSVGLEEGAPRLPSRSGAALIEANTHVCDKLICDALGELEDETDGAVEEFLPQLANLLLGCAENGPQLDPSVDRDFTGMRHCLEAAMLKRCAARPFLAAKLAWVLDDIAASTATTPLVSERANKFAAACREVHRSDLDLGDLVALVDQLVSVVFELSAVKNKYQVPQFALVPHAAARLEWVNRNVAFIHAARCGWVRRPETEVLAHVDRSADQGTELSLSSIEERLGRERPDVLSMYSPPLLPFSTESGSMRLLRLLPSEVVVLNSASRAPLMVFAEVLDSSGSADVEPQSTPSLLQNAEPVDSLLSNLMTRRIDIPPEDMSRHGDIEHTRFLHNLRAGFGELWSEKTKRVKSLSPYGHLPGWRLVSFLIKSGDNIRREGHVMQWVRLFEKIWNADNVPVYVRPYTIVCCGDRCGLLENVAMARSVDSIKKGTKQAGLVQCFSALFPTPVSFHRAQHNFMRSLVSYSIITYIFQVRDRHNGNILIDSFGHCIHIDFGYILGDSPGGNLGWEKAPFKLTKEFYDVLGGLGSPLWFEFVELMVQAFGALRLHVEEVLALVQASIPEEFERKGLRDVLFNRLMISDDEVRMLVQKSVDSTWTVTYDIMQRVQNGIM